MKLTREYWEHPGFLAAMSLADESGCAKQRVGAAIWSERYGLLGAGNNDVNRPHKVCPRELNGRKSGEGYVMCRDICDQQAHAEVAAIANARTCYPSEAMQGAKLYMWGHDYSCADCTREASEAGITTIAFPRDAIGHNPSVRRA